jgi:hypothetical protein
MGLVPAQSAALALQQLALAIHAPLHILNPGPQLHTPAPEQMKLVPHEAAVCPVQFPPEQVPTGIRLLPMHIALPQLPVGNEQRPLAPQIPAQALFVPAQSVLSQQFAVGMQPVPHGLNPDVQLEQRPAPEQVKFPPQGAGGGSTQVPLAQVPVPTRFTPEQVGLPHVPVG